MEFDKDLRSIQEARELAAKGAQAAKELEAFTEDQIDAIIKHMADVGEKHALELAEMAVEETGFGIVRDKVFKNHMATGMLYESIKDMKTQGIIKEDTERRMVEIADPVGLIMGIVPSTNPTSTAMYKSIIALKARNPIVFSPHPSAAKCTYKAAELMRQAAVEAGAPEGCIGCLQTLSIDATNELMHHKDVKLIIATGGPGMVKAAYSAGKPAIGVGAGNSPAYIERSANVKEAIKKIMASKTFDNGTVCASEQSIICEKVNEHDVIEELKKQGAYFMSEAETKAVCELLFKNGHSMNAKFVAKKPQVIAEAAGFSVDPGIKLLVGRQTGVGEGNPLSYEKLTTVIAFYTVEDWKEACELSIALLQNGIGHTMSLHTENPDIALKFAAKPASRILVNTGGTQGGTGVSTGLAPAFTLGCGTIGGSSVSENVTPLHLINKKVLAYGIKDVTKLAVEDEIYQKYHGDLTDNERACSLSTNSNYGNSEKSMQLSKDDLAEIIAGVVKALKQ